MSEVFVKDADDAYALGLWCADSYWWSSSIGLSNVESELILRFGIYLAKILDPDRVRLRIYEVPGNGIDDRVRRLTERVSVRPSHKMKRTAYHVYVNSRPLVRLFFEVAGDCPNSIPSGSVRTSQGGSMATVPSGAASGSHTRPMTKRCWIPSSSVQQGLGLRVFCITRGQTSTASTSTNRRLSVHQLDPTVFVEGIASPLRDCNGIARWDQKVISNL